MSTREFDLIQSYSRWERPFGMTYGAWTVKWWQWMLSDSTPLADQTGEDWNINQPPSYVWFLAGNLGSIDKTFPSRNIREIQFGRSILFPVLNCEANSLEYPNLKTHEDLVKHVLHDVDSVVKKDVFVDGVKLDAVRVPSDPKIFNVTINENNPFGVQTPGLIEATADGYWTFLKPLQRGSHIIHFEGACEFGKLNSGASYKFVIM